MCETHVDGRYLFPVDRPRRIWTAVETLDLPAGEKDNYPTRFVVYERRRS